MSITNTRGSHIQQELEMNRDNNKHENYNKNQLIKPAYTHKNHPMILLSEM